MAIVFDPVNYRIILDTTDVTATEIYSRWIDWAATSDNMKYGPVFRQVGFDDLGGGLLIPPYFFLQGSWRVRPMEANHTLTITGNLFVDGGGDPIAPTLGNYNVLVKTVVPVQAQGINTSSSGASAADVWAHPTRTITSVIPTPPTPTEISTQVWADAPQIATDAPTPEQNAAAVWQALIESGMSAADLMRIMASFIAGDGAQLESSTPQFKSLDGAKIRLQATYDKGTRTMTTVDGT